MTDDVEARAPQDEIVVDCQLDAPPEKVWRALTVPDLLDAWLATGELGAHVDRRLLEAEPNRLIRYGWREDRAGNGDLDSVVTFHLSETDAGGTRLRIVHGDFAITMMAANANTPSASLRRAA